jgi:copper homeostasis protein
MQHCEVISVTVELMKELNMKPEGRYLLEICLESVESVIAAEQGGADRVELCSDLFEGGLTPSLGTFRTAKASSHIPLNVIIRPRGGDFCYSDREFAVMKEDIRIFRDEGASGLVFGILTPEGEIDEARTAELIELANPLPVTFHRAFDMTKDAYASLDTLIRLGVTRVLTSGQEATVMEGFRLLRDLISYAGDRIIVMPGNGITERNFDFIREQIGAKEYHAYLPGEIPTRMRWQPQHISMGGQLRQNEFTVSHTDRELVARLAAGRG